MAPRSAVASRASVRPSPRGHLARLRDLVDEAALVTLGWDPATQVFTPDPAHAVLGFSTCEVIACPYSAKGPTRLCCGCGQVWSAQARPDLAVFKAKGVQRTRMPALLGLQLCRVCCTPGHERPARIGGLCHCCQGRARVRGQSVDSYIAGDDRFPPAVPRRSFGRCRVSACRWWAETNAGLCRKHLDTWAVGKPEGDAFVAWCAAAPALRGNQALVFNLRGLGETMRLELLFGLQAAVADGRRTAPASLSALINYARSSGAGSLVELANVDHTGAGVIGGMALRYLVGELEVGLATPETEAVRDSWNLRVFGQSGRLHFNGLTQPWLREGVKRWGAGVLARLQTQRSLITGLYALEELSVSLAQRPDRGLDPRLLSRRDIEAFTVRLAHLTAAGEMSTYRRTYTVRFVTRLLRQAREEGLTAVGGPMAGLPLDFALGPRDQVHRPHDDAPGRALPQLVVDQLLSEESLQLLEDRAGPAWRAMLELQAVVGRRTGELCELRWDCLVHDERVDDEGVARRYPVLVHDMPKARVTGYRLPITEHEAAIIRAQQQRSRSQHPDTPAGALALFPTPVKNPQGTKSSNPKLFAHIVHDWVASLPVLDSPDRDADGCIVPFPRELVFPYAFRHTYAQRHADGGTAVDVLKELMGHTTLASTQGYYRVTAVRRRNAVDALAALQIDRTGRRLRPLVDTLLESEVLRDQIGEVSVPFGTCVEPSNVRAQGRACPMRFQCLGCAHYRTDPSYQESLRGHLTRLLTDKERLASSLPDLDEWARLGALPSDEEIEALRRLIRRNEELMSALAPQERTTVEEAIQVMRAARAQLQTAVPVQLLGTNSQSAPTVFPDVGRRRGEASGG